MTGAPVVTDEIDVAIYLREFGKKPIAVLDACATPTARHRSTKPWWGESHEVIYTARAQLGVEVVPDRLCLWVSVNEDFRHFFLPIICSSVSSGAKTIGASDLNLRVSRLGNVPHMVIHSRKSRFYVTAIFVALASNLSIQTANAEIKDGDACSTIGKIQNVKTSTSMTDYICKEESGRKIWRILKVAGGVSGGKSGNQSTNNGSKNSGTSKITIEKGPVLSVPPFKASALDCTDYGPSPIPASCFRPYGFSFKRDSGETKVLPSNQYILAPNTEVVAVTDADMVIVEYQQDSKDYEVLLIVFTTQNDAVWKIAYDHIDQVLVKKGSSVKAGQRIGIKKTRSDFELQVNQIRDQRGEKGNFYVCPKSLGSAAFNKFHDEALKKSNAAFPKFAVNSVCLKPSIATSEYRG